MESTEQGAGGPRREDSPEWDDVSSIISASVPADSPEIWLGEIVLAAQAASDQAVGWAQRWADGARAAAAAEAAEIRRQGREEAARYVPPSIRPAAAPPPLRAPREWDRVLSWPVRPAPDTDPVGAEVGPAVAAQEPADSPSPAAPTLTVAGDSVAPPNVVSLPRKTAGGPPTEPAAIASARLCAPESPPAAVSPPTTRLRIDRCALVAALVAVLAALGLVGFERYATASEEHSAQARLVARFARQEAAPVPVVMPPAGGVLGLLTVPRAGISGLAIIEGATLGHLREGPVHDAASQLPGQRGAVVILGHARTYGGPLARLGALRVGDVISLRTATGLYAYRVSRRAVVLGSGASSSVALPSTAASGGATDQVVVLGTGAGFRDTHLQVVVATLDRAPSDVSGPPASGPPITTALRTVPGQLVGLVYAVFWLIGLDVIVYWARRLGRKWAPAAVYPVAGLTLLLMLYQLYSAIDRLVPGIA